MTVIVLIYTGNQLRCGGAGVQMNLHIGHYAGFLRYRPEHFGNALRSGIDPRLQSNVAHDKL
jgi:hypothetical protein